ncbi:MAG: stage III sporulation protein AE [Lachnospiraceae bacterium]|nr:stage III sporulation protein AE [Lachnospiraceae bacterium]
MDDLTDFGQLQDLLASILSSNEVSFSELVGQLQAGDFQGMKDSLEQLLLGWLKGGELLHLSDYAGVLLLVLLFALLRAVGQAFDNRSVTAFSGVVIQLLMIVQLAALFRGFLAETKQYLEHIISFAGALFPVLAVAAAAGGETVTAAGIYASAISISSLVSRVCLYILLPGISIYLVISLLDSIMPEALLSGLSGLLKKGMSLLMKLSFASVSGLQVIQMMVLPKADSVRRQTLLKTASMIPGAGGLADTAATVLWESSSLLKGSIGAAGMFCILLICLLPVVRIALVSALYHVMSAVALPAADKNVSRCLSGFAESLEYLVKVTCLCAVILLLMIAMAVR